MDETIKPDVEACTSMSSLQQKWRCNTKISVSSATMSAFLGLTSATCRTIMVCASSSIVFMSRWKIMTLSGLSSTVTRSVPVVTSFFVMKRWLWVMSLQVNWMSSLHVYFVMHRKSSTTKGDTDCYSEYNVAHWINLQRHTSSWQGDVFNTYFRWCRTYTRFST